MLAEKGETPAFYEDVLRSALLKGRSPKSLVERGNLLHLTTRKTPETIFVASPACFAWDLRDFAGALTAAAARNSPVVFLDTGLEVPPDAGIAALHAALEAFERAKNQAKTKPGQIKGWIKAVESRRADTDRRLDLIRDDWRLRQHTTKELLLRAGMDGKPMALNTAKLHLGDRELNQDKEQRRLKDRQVYLARKEAKANEQD